MKWQLLYSELNAFASEQNSIMQKEKKVCEIFGFQLRILQTNFGGSDWYYAGEGQLI